MNVSVPEEIVEWFSHAQNMSEHLAGRRIVERLGKGGFGSVYKVVNPVTGSAVALKILSDDGRSDKRSAMRKRENSLKTEFKFFSKIRHPNLIPIYDMGRTKGRLFIVMEFADDKDLSQRMEDPSRPLDDNERLRIMKFIACGMTYIAEQGLIHGDIKPANVLLFKNGQVKLTDFGLSRRRGWSTESVAKGTPHYMAPEQILKRSIGEYSDIYSLGVMMYEMFTGIRPFPVPRIVYEGRVKKVKVPRPGSVDKHTILKQHVKQKPLRPTEINPRISRPLEQTIIRCMEKNIKKRYDKLHYVWADLINCPEFGGRI
ncbi:MAG: serine/threonine protein kinase [Candidatus Hydrogenedentes bacterium]|nr:serine/threonine protein kinase [Candidatus Hydrogenedentota bacterium]